MQGHTIACHTFSGAVLQDAVTCTFTSAHAEYFPSQAIMHAAQHSPPQSIANAAKLSVGMGMTHSSVLAAECGSMLMQVQSAAANAAKQSVARHDTFTCLGS